MGGMTIVRGYPPLIDEIDAAFKVRGKPVIFAWGSTIYASFDAKVGPEKVVHEAVHGDRQGDDVVGWWRRYIADPAFRLAEEIPAHVAEYLALCEMEPNRGGRRRAIKTMAENLSAPLYGRMISQAEAKRVILAGAEAVRGRAEEIA